MCFHRILQWCHLSCFSSMTFIARSWILKEILIQFEKLPTRIWPNMTNGRGGVVWAGVGGVFHACNNLKKQKKQKAIQTQFLSVKAVGSSWGCAFVTATGICLEGESEDRLVKRGWWRGRVRFQIQDRTYPPALADRSCSWQACSRVADDITRWSGTWGATS